MKALVTGGLGFLGSHLVERLLQAECSVTIVDNQSTNAVGPHFFANSCRVVTNDVMDYEQDETFDLVFHLASVVGPAGVLKHSGNIGCDMIQNAKRMFELCLGQGASFILVSTSEVYGRDGVFPEDVYKIVPAKITVRGEYGAGKLLAEVSTINKAKVAPLRFHIIRPFNIAGPRQQPLGGFVLPRFIRQAVNEEPITVFGDGTQQRAFTHVRDIVEGIVSVAFSDVTNEVWNIGNLGNRTTINELASLVREVTKTRSDIVHIDPKTVYGTLYEEAFDKLPDTSKIERVLGWRPKYDLEGIVRDTYEYYLSREYPRVDTGTFN